VKARPDPIKAVPAIKQVGYTTDEAQGAVQKTIGADMDPEKATGLSKAAARAEHGRGGLHRCGAASASLRLGIR